MEHIEKLKEQKKAIEDQLAEATKKARSDAIASIREMMTAHGIELSEIGGRVSKAKGTKVPVKYRDEAGNTWTGRGKTPVWVRSALVSGKELAQFAVR